MVEWAFKEMTEVSLSDPSGSTPYLHLQSDPRAPPGPGVSGQGGGREAQEALRNLAEEVASEELREGEVWGAGRSKPS